MKTIIKCNTAQDAENIYSILIDPKGPGSENSSILFGSKKYLDDHTQLPTILEFDLTKQEAEAVSKLAGVKSVHTRLRTPTPVPYVNWISQPMEPRPVGFGGPDNATMPLVAPHSLITSTNSEAIFSHDEPLAVGSLSVVVDFNDCSNVDIIVIDSGIDSEHPDFVDLNTGSSRVVDFDWGVFEELDVDGNPAPIIYDFASRRPYFLKDSGGHGTACASLAAGNRCGVGKNAQLFSLKIFSEPNEPDSKISVTQALKCALAFLTAKANNEHGLDSSRPTIITNSWGYGRYSLETSDAHDFGDSENENKKTLARVGNSALQKAYPFGLPACIGSEEVTEVDEYARAIVDAGGHFLHAAGNENAYVDHSSETVCDYHLITRFGEPISIPSTPESDLFFDEVIANSPFYQGSYLFTTETNGNVAPEYWWPGYLTYYGKTSFGFYSSPGVGLGFSKDDYPIITVGDLSLVGHRDTIELEWENLLGWEATSYVEPYLADNDDKTLIQPSVRQRNYDDRRYVKSWYSNFGPSVDIYATGNNTIAAKSKQSTSTAYVSGNEGVDGDVYIPFNGTSAATPIVAGILASYLAEFPTATPQEARDWLIANSSKGNIVETASITKSYTDTNGVLQDTECLDISCNKFLTVGGSCKSASRETYLNFAQFYNSQNRIAQAYPLKNAVVNSNDPTVEIANSNLNLSETGLTIPETHTI